MIKISTLWLSIELTQGPLRETLLEQKVAN